jgi:coenzyme F420-0:L-glutamate ligase / coenzyme F420-1:gamma-L-glutamate ligase
VITVLPLEGIPEIEEGADLAGLLAEAADRAGGFEPRDVLVVAQKAVSKAEGRVVALSDVEPSEEALAQAGDGDPS